MSARKTHGIDSQQVSRGGCAACGDARSRLAEGRCDRGGFGAQSGRVGLVSAYGRSIVCQKVLEIGRTVGARSWQVDIGFPIDRAESDQSGEQRHGGRDTVDAMSHLDVRLPAGSRGPGVAAQGVTTHRLRHTTLTWVERTFSYAVAQAFAGHRGKRSGTTDTYVKSQLHEVAAALSVLTAEPHPLTRGALPPPQELVALTASRTKHQ